MHELQQRIAYRDYSHDYPDSCRIDVTLDSQSIKTTVSKDCLFIRCGFCASTFTHIICGGGLYYVLVSLVLLLIAVPAFSAEPAASPESAPTTPGPPPTTEPPVSPEPIPGAEPVPTEEPAVPPEAVPPIPGPLPPPQERALSPIPQQFEWIQRDVQPNPILEAIIGLREGLLALREGPPVLFMSVFVSEEFNDNTFLEEEDREHDFLTSLGIGTAFRFRSGRNFVSLANTIRGQLSARFSDQNDIGFANLALNAGHQEPRWSIALNESFVRDDDPIQASPSGIRRGRRNFLRNRVSPQFRYAFTRLTSVNLAYTNTIVQRNDDNNDDNNDGNNDNSITHSVTTDLQTRFTRALSGNVGYRFEATNNEDADDRIAHSASGTLGYILGRRTSASLQAFGTITNRSDGGVDSQSYGMSIGVRRQLTTFLAMFASLGATVFDAEDRGSRVFPNWQLNLDGGLPLFRRATLTLSTRQSIEDTSGDVDNIGIVSRQSVIANLSYLISRRLRTSLFASFARTEDLETIGTAESERGRIDNFWRAGASASYAISRILSFSLSYQYQQRDSNEAEDYYNNRVTATLSAGFPLF